MTYEFALDPASPPDLVAATVREHGVAYLPGFAATAPAADECRRLLDLREPWVTPLEYSIGQAVRVLRSELDARGYAALGALLADPHLAAIAGALLPGEHRFNHDVYVVKDVVGATHFAHDLHYDRMRHIKFFFYLTDTGPDNGPLYCIPRSHGLAPRLQRDNRMRGIIPSEAETRLLPPGELGEGTTVEGPAGTLIVLDSDLLHRATPVRAGHRLAVRSRSIDPRLLEAAARNAETVSDYTGAIRSK